MAMDEQLDSIIIMEEFIGDNISYLVPDCRMVNILYTPFSWHQSKFLAMSDMFLFLPTVDHARYD
jgi:hypothetical protein